ncbi:hypothetical protein TNCV_285521, partial [Trichonephila clavipes]
MEGRHKRSQRRRWHDSGGHNKRVADDATAANEGVSLRSVQPGGNDLLVNSH